MRQPGSVRVCSIASCGLLLFAATARSQQVVVPDPSTYYYADGKRVAVTLPKDSLGIVTRSGATDDQIDAALAQVGLDVKEKSVDGNLLIVVLDESREIVELERVSRELTENARKLTDGPIKNAGLLALGRGASRPMILTEEFVVDFNQSLTQPKIKEIIEKQKVEIVRQVVFRDNQFVLRSTNDSGLGFLDSANRFHEMGEVSFSQPNFVRPKSTRTTDPMLCDQWHLENTGQGGGTVDADIDATKAWNITNGSPEVVIAVIDFGFEVNHPDLSPNVWTNPGDDSVDMIDNDENGYDDDINGWDFVDCDGVLSDASKNDRAHGMKVAGCVGVRGGNCIGVSGTCQECRLILIRIGKTTTDADDAAAIRYATHMGADVINNSWGYEDAPIPEIVAQAIGDATTIGRNGLGAIVFFAMTDDACDNGAAPNACSSYPDISSLEEVIAVSRSTNFDRFDNSGHGNCMDVLAPSRANTPGAGSLSITTTTEQSFNGGYSDSFGGTSASAPIAAGIAGLMLDVAPDLSRLQIQRALQDTADRIEHSVGQYSCVTGFSSPATGIATHGYGRVNAFEAVRLVMPESDDDCGAVDVFLRDNHLDWGNTEQPSDTVFGPPGGKLARGESVDIKVDAFPFDDAVTNSRLLDKFAHESPVAGVTNRVYVRVRNRGTHAAESVVVKLHWALAGSGPPALPSDFWMLFPEDATATSVWHPVQKQTIDHIEYCGSSVAGSDLDGAEVLTFEWDAPSNSPQEVALLVVVTCDGDPVATHTTSSSNVDDLTLLDNNVTLLTVTLTGATKTNTEVP